ncbi:hypothetical protein C7S16_0167 [Burkholderia thailandensis]|uniref:Uncharacterized protein n=1 Tax=Burkholderia thailandensis TaxID=57975 RepID=A0AAW9D1H9_BURTH|nr:hypothetical protein [Burkholderia thailandensis]MDW9254854.1 hypothetical protein [Burkholderia thailandensis]
MTSARSGDARRAAPRRLRGAAAMRAAARGDRGRRVARAGASEPSNGPATRASMERRWRAPHIRIRTPAVRRPRGAAVRLRRPPLPYAIRTHP